MAKPVFLHNKASEQMSTITRRIKREGLMEALERP